MTLIDFFPIKSLGLSSFFCIEFLYFITFRSKFYIYLVAVLWFVVPVVAMIRSYIGVCEKTKECGAVSCFAFYTARGYFQQL